MSECAVFTGGNVSWANAKMRVTVCQHSISKKEGYMQALIT